MKHGKIYSLSLPKSEGIFGAENSRVFINLRFSQDGKKLVSSKDAKFSLLNETYCRTGEVVCPAGSKDELKQQYWKSSVHSEKASKL